MIIYGVFLISASILRMGPSYISLCKKTAILDFQSKRFKLFLIYKSPQCFLPSFESTGLSLQKKKRRIDFRDDHHGGHLGFPIGTILAFSLFIVLIVIAYCSRGHCSLFSLLSWSFLLALIAIAHCSHCFHSQCSLLLWSLFIVLCALMVISQ